MGLPPTGLYTLCWTHGQTLSILFFYNLILLFVFLIEIIIIKRILTIPEYMKFPDNLLRNFTFFRGNYTSIPFPVCRKRSPGYI